MGVEASKRSEAGNTFAGIMSNISRRKSKNEDLEKKKASA